MVLVFRLSAELSVFPLYLFTEVLVGGVAVSKVGVRVDFFESKRFFPSQDRGRIMFTGTIASASECAERSRCPCPREWPEDAWRDQEKRDHGRTLMKEVGNRLKTRKELDGLGMIVITVVTLPRGKDHDPNRSLRTQPSNSACFLRLTKLSS